MKVLGKFITSQSDFDRQPVWLIEVQNLSFELQRKIVEAVDSQQPFIMINSKDWEELSKCNSFELANFPCVIDGYVDFLV